MKSYVVFVVGMLHFLTLSKISYAKDVFIFPRADQSTSQQRMDKDNCKNWAESEAKVDIDIARAKLQMIEETEAELVESYDEEYAVADMVKTVFQDATRGAALGAIDDAIDKEVGTYAAQEGLKSILNVRRDKADYKRAQDENARHKRKVIIRRDVEQYYKAFSACMDAKGYSVN